MTRIKCAQTLVLLSAICLGVCHGCSTIDLDIPCVFPFTFKDVTYNGCTNVGDPEGKLWCATKVDENGSYILNSNQYGYCTENCPEGDIETIDIRSIDDDKLVEIDRNCEKGETCKYRTSCPEFQTQKANLDKLSRRSQEYKETLIKIRTSVCNKKEKGVCCPKTNVDKCKRGFSCVKEDQCEYAQELRKQYKKGDNNAKQTLIGLICDRKERTFCCPPVTVRRNPPRNPLNSKRDPTWLPGQVECGMNPDISPTRVIGGVDTTPGMFPFTALLGYQAQEKRWIERKRKWEIVDFIKYKCGGTLINHWYVVTAAHCQGRSKRSKISEVRLGEWEVGRDPDCLKSGKCLDKVQDFDITTGQVIVHKDYQRRAYNVENDIALIKLTRPAHLNSGVHIACLTLDPQTDARALNIPDLRAGLEGTRPNVVGWGYTEYDAWAPGQQGDFNETHVASSVQQRLGVPILSSSECKRKFNNFNPNNNQICAGGEPGKDSCKANLPVIKIIKL